MWPTANGIPILPGYLYHADAKNPHESAGHCSAGVAQYSPRRASGPWMTADAEAVDFADFVNTFLDVFGLKQESEALLAKVQAVAGEVGSQSWYLAQSALGEQLLDEGRVAEAGEGLPCGAGRARRRAQFRTSHDFG